MWKILIYKLRQRILHDEEHIRVEYLPYIITKCQRYVLTAKEFDMKYNIKLQQNFRVQNGIQ